MEPAALVQSDARPTDDDGFDTRRVRQHSFVEMDHEIFSASISSFHWFKKASFQFLAKECAYIFVNCLEDSTGPG